MLTAIASLDKKSFFWVASYANIFMDKLEEKKHLRHANQIYTHIEKSATTPELEIVVGDQSQCKIFHPKKTVITIYLRQVVMATVHYNIFIYKNIVIS
jgi:hypothetical protein